MRCQYIVEIIAGQCVIHIISAQGANGEDGMEGDAGIIGPSVRFNIFPFLFLYMMV